MSPTLPDRLDVARLPTPIHGLPRLSARLGGPKLWIKRDDQTGSLLSGNKIRKLQFAVAEARSRGVDTLITCGGVQSNHCRATAVLARQLGMHVVLLLRGEAPTTPEANYLLDKVLGAEVHLVSPEQYDDRERAMEQLAQQQRDQGRSPVILGEGCSTATGCWGYIEAVAEIVASQTQLGVEFDAVVSAVGSGGTNAGLELGARLYGLRAKVWGIPVCDDETHFRKRIHELCTEADKEFGLGVGLRPEDIGLIGGYVGEGYGNARPEELEALVAFARDEGIIVDPVYGAKAFYGLVQEIAAGRFTHGQNVLFVHTGGIFGLQPYAAQLPL